MSKFTIPKPTTLDRVISHLSPSWGASRLRSRAQVAMYEYQAAMPSLSRNQPETRNDPRSSQAARERATITRLGRNLVENFPIVTGIIRKVAPYAIGDLRYEANTGDEDLDNRLEDLLAEDFSHIDVTNRHDLSTFSNIALCSMLVDGDVASSPVFIDDHLRFELIESDCIGNPDISINSQYYVSGIHLDRLGRPVSYDIFRRSINSGGYYEFVGEIGAMHIDMMYDTLRYSDYRGVSAFASSIRENQDLREILDAGRDRVKFAASLAAIVTNKEGGVSSTELFRNGGTYSQTPGGKIIENTMQGTVIYQAQGDSVQAFNSQFPEQAVATFLKFLIQIIANSLNLPYGFVFDLSSLGGPGSRYEASQVQRQFEWWQDLLRKRILSPMVRRLILSHAASGRLGDVDPMDMSLYRGRWMFPAKISIDSRDEKIEIDGIRAGTKTLSEYCAERQKDWKDHQDQVIRERKRNVDKSVDAGIVPIDQVLITPSGQVPQSTPVGEDTAEPLISTIGIGGVQAMTEILSKVGTGEISRDSAIAMFESVFGMTRGQAESIVGTPKPIQPPE